MNAWDLTVNLKDVVIDFGLLSLFLVIATILRRYVTFFQKFLIPNNIVAGFLALIVGPQILGITDITSDRLGLYVYHLLALTFIAIGLREEKSDWGKGPISTGLAFVSNYLIQGILGLAIALILIYTVMPDLFAGMGLLLPLGYGMGPGVAYTMGHSWEAFGFVGGGNVGLTFAAIGYLIAYFAGIWLIQIGIKRRETKLIDGMEGISRDMRIGVVQDKEPEVAGRLTLSTEAIEPYAFQLGLIGFIYLLTYALVYFLSGLMESAGLHDFTSTLWSFHFVLGNLLSIGFRKVMDMTKKSYLIDAGLMTRSAGVFVDYLVVGAIAAISLVIVGQYWLPLVLMSAAGGIGSYFLCRWLQYRAFDDNHFERFIGIFGEMTGTINSGLVLVRVTDPEFRTPVAEDLVYGSGVALLTGFPLLIVLNVPMNVFGNSLFGYWVTLGILIGYLGLIWGIWHLIGFLSFKKQKPAE
ncbi:MAG: sodium:glutamate symporter [Candidatus Marinimicrobia bacterium]|nr:sodium:glutamate symporter [Candidatus Neomarinimicrobiota bacterium]MCF7828065.1 sodium:glutamate symporter [Candidatus Neomarinimicrobiota bacterium]MCF7879760.1 sodium:glutamate symporter [Candidatus Neomarinimicrobiota bacterium]